MSIELDWELESNDGIERVGEDPAVVAVREKRKRLLRRTLVIAGVLVGIGLSLTAVRLWQTSQQSRIDLEATIAAETLALRMGDSDAFMAIQMPDDYWKSIQAETFADYQSRHESIIADGKIVSLDISADQARVVLAETYNGEAYQVMWFYQRGAKGWKHIPPQVSFFGAEKQISTAHAEIHYSSIDESAAQELAVLIEEWWTSLEGIVPCNLSPCSRAPEPVVITMSTDFVEAPTTVKDDPEQLILRSPHLDRYPAGDNSLSPEIRNQAARWLVAYWTGNLLKADTTGHIRNSDRTWLREELTRWLVQEIMVDGPPAPILDWLGQKYGQEAIFELVRGIQLAANPASLLEAITDQDVETIPVDWSLYLETRLRYEAKLIRAKQIDEWFTLTDQITFSNGYVGPDFRTEDGAIPESITVTRTYWLNGLLWAEVRFQPRGKLGNVFEQMVAYEPYRLVNDQLFHTHLNSSDERNPRTDNGEHFVLYYNQIDGEAAAGALQFLENKYDQFASDLQLKSPPLRLNIYINGSGARGPETNTILIPSIVDTAHSSTLTTQRSMRLQISQQALIWVIYYNLPDREGRYFLAEAIARWEMARLGLDDTVVYSPDLIITSQLGAVEASSILSSNSLDEFNNPAYARALIDYVGEQYGVAGVQRMLATLDEATDLTDWIDRANLVTIPEAP